MTTYIFEIDLTKEVGLPAYQVYKADGNGYGINPSPYPIRTMPPRLMKNDTIAIEFKLPEIEGKPGIAINWEETHLYVRPIRNSTNKTSPFGHLDSDSVKNEWKHRLATYGTNGSWTQRKFTIDETDGYWAFTIIGVFVKNGTGFHTPFFVDPEAQVGSGVSSPR